MRIPRLLIIGTAGGAGSQTANVDFISAGSSLFEPTLSPGQVTLSADFIAAGTALYEPSVTAGAATISADFISAGSTLYTPTISSCTNVNELVYSEDFDGIGAAYWDDDAVTPSLTSGQSDPLGGSNAYIVDDVDATNLALLRHDGVTSTVSDSYTLSVFIKKDASPTVYPSIVWGQATNWRSIVIDPSDGSFVDASYTSAGTTGLVESYDANWWRASVSGVSDFSSGQLVALYPAYNATGNGVSDGTVTGSNIFFGAQFEQCASPTVYKKTALFTIDADFISSGSVLYEPVVTAGFAIPVDFISAGSNLFEPTLTPGAVTASADFISAGSTLYEPTVSPGAVTVSADFISSGSSLFEPTLSADGQVLSADFISSGSTLHEPVLTLGAVTLSLDFITAGSILYEPTVTGGDVLTATVYTASVTTEYTARATI